MWIRAAYSQQLVLEIPAGRLDVSLPKIENSFLLILYIIVEAFNAAKPFFFSLCLILSRKIGKRTWQGAEICRESFQQLSGRTVTGTDKMTLSRQL